MSESMISYPHPVFGNGDDVSGKINQPQFSYSITDEIIELNVEDLSTGNEDIDSLINSGEAAWQIRVHCARTYMRESFIANGDSWAQKLSGPDYEGTVTIESNVIALRPIEQYLPVNSHDDYSGEKFDLSTGELLAVTSPSRFSVDKDYDPLKAPVSSFIKVIEGDHKEGEYKVVFDDDLIFVKLSKSDWLEYPGIRDRVPALLHSALVLPVLTEAIRCMGEYASTRWSGRLQDIVEARDIDVENPLEGAQKLLSDPLSRSFKSINLELDKRGH
jgi:hypothetical protein